MSNLKLGIAVVGIVLIVAATYLTRQADENASSAVGTTAHPPIPEPQHTASDESSKQDKNPVGHTTASGRSVKLAAEMTQARDYRVLFESLLQWKTPGAGLYAINILSRCSRMRDAKLPPPGDSTAQQQARQLLIDRCASFTQEELALQARFDLNRDPRTQDPYRATQNEWAKNQLDPVKRDLILSQALDDGDPLLLEFIGTTIFYRSQSQSPMFDGQPYPQPDALVIMNAAWNAAVCEGTSNSCGTNDPYVVEMCAMQSICTTSRQEAIDRYVEAKYGIQGKELYESIYPKLVDSIINKRSSAFRLR